MERSADFVLRNKICWFFIWFDGYTADIYPQKTHKTLFTNINPEGAYRPELSTQILASQILFRKKIKPVYTITICIADLSTQLLFREACFIFWLHCRSLNAKQIRESDLQNFICTCLHCIVMWNKFCGYLSADKVSLGTVWTGLKNSDFIQMC